MKLLWYAWHAMALTLPGSRLQHAESVVRLLSPVFACARLGAAHPGPYNDSERTSASRCVSCVVTASRLTALLLWPRAQDFHRKGPFQR